MPLLLAAGLGFRAWFAAADGQGIHTVWRGSYEVRGGVGSGAGHTECGAGWAIGKGEEWWAGRDECLASWSLLLASLSHVRPWLMRSCARYGTKALLSRRGWGSYGQSDHGMVGVLMTWYSCGSHGQSDRCGFHLARCRVVA